MTDRVPQRTCIGCRAIQPTNELVRVTVASEPVDDELIRVDERGRGGRGAWVCRSTVCVTAAVARSAFSRAFRTKLPDGICGDTLIDWLRLHPGPVPVRDSQPELQD